MEIIFTIADYSAWIGSGIFISAMAIVFILAIIVALEEILFSRYTSGKKKSLSGRVVVVGLMGLVLYLTWAGIHHWYIGTLNGSFFGWMTQQLIAIIFAWVSIKVLRKMFATT